MEPNLPHGPHHQESEKKRERNRWSEKKWKKNCSHKCELVEKVCYIWNNLVKFRTMHWNHVAILGYLICASSRTCEFKQAD